MRKPRVIGYSVSAIVVIPIIVVALAAYAAPLVSIDQPRDKEIISGTADIRVSYVADGSSPIERVQVFIDGQLVKDYRLDKPETQGNRTFRWEFSLEGPSRHSISARAQDSSGAAGATGIKVEVRRTEGVQPASAVKGEDRTPPTVDIYYPAEGQVVSGEVRVKADVSDNVGVRTVVFFLDGKFKTMMMNSPNYSDRLDTTQMSDGPHMVRVSAYDADENEGRAERSFIVQNRQATSGQGTGESRTAVKPDLTLTPPPVPDVLQPSVPEVKSPIPSAPEVKAPAAASTGPSGAQPELVAKLPGSVAETETRPAVGRPGGVAKASPPAVGPLETRAEPPSTSAVAVVGAGGEGLPAPTSVAPPVVTLQPPPKPSTSGVVAKLPAYGETRVAAAGAPAEWRATPLSGKAGGLKAVPVRPAPTTPATRDVAALGGLKGEAAARPSMPADATWTPKVTEVLGRPAVIVAEPGPPQGGYAGSPVGQPRQALVAMLPRGHEGEATAKIAMPGVDVAEMARFRDVKIVFNGKLIPLRAAPEVLGGISITPLREVFENCDGTLYWFHQEKRVHAVNPAVDMELKIGDATAKVNGETEDLVLAPYIKNGRTMVPLEFLAATLDVTVSFNSSTGELIVSRNGF